MSGVPLTQAKSDLFRALAHPVRVRVLELLVDRPMTVAELRADVGVEASSLSQQLAVLRAAGVVSSTRRGTTVVYAVSSPAVSDLLAAGRAVLSDVWSGAGDMLAELREGS